MKTIAITGASGFVGQALTKHFESQGQKVVKISRSQLSKIDDLAASVDGADLVINLAGANIINRWSEEYKKLLYSSRIDTTQSLIKAFQKTTIKPKLFISTSAVGIYNNVQTHDENSEQLGEDFLANLCKDWERTALEAKDIGIRTAIFRFGIVLGSGGGALEKMLTPFKLGLGGTIGDGKQAFSFIHIDDLLQAYDFVMKNENLDGVFNLTAPNPTTNKGLTKALGEALHRPTILPVPTFMLNIIFSEGAKVLTDGQSAVPKKLLDNGFEFEYKDIDQTIQAIV
jgi:uncharacterized protein (TIGR01777 family)